MATSWEQGEQQHHSSRAGLRLWELGAGCAGACRCLGQSNMRLRCTLNCRHSPPHLQAAGTKMYEDKKRKAVHTLEKKQLKVDEINKVGGWGAGAWASDTCAAARLQCRALEELGLPPAAATHLCKRALCNAMHAGAAGGHLPRAGQAAAGEGAVHGVAERHQEPGAPHALLRGVEVLRGVAVRLWRRAGLRPQRRPTGTVCSRCGVQAVATCACLPGTCTRPVLTAAAPARSLPCPAPLP